MTSNLRENLVGEWYLNAGEAKDTSGNGNHGTLTGTTSIADHLNRDNMAIDFNGSSDYINFATPANFEFSNDFSFSGWFKVDNIATTQRPMNCTLDTNSNNFAGWSLTVLNSKIYFGYAASSTVFNWAISSVLTSGTWYHISGTKSSVNGVKVYINGVQDGTNAAVTNISYGTEASSFEFGRQLNDGSPEAYYGGIIENLRVWDRVLTVTEINQLYNNTKSNYQGLFDGIVGAWDFKGDAKDWSGNGNDGTVTGATLAIDKFNISNNSYSFDGTGDYINFGIMSFKTINLWMKATVSSSGFVGAKYTSSEPSGAWDLILTSGNPGVRIYAAANDGKYVFTTGLDVLDGNWHMLTATSDGTTLKIYVDGNFEGQNTSVNNWFTGGGIDSFYLGRVGDNTVWNYYTGALDKIETWNRVLSADEIQTLYDVTSKKNIYTYVRESNDS